MHGGFSEKIPDHSKITKMYFWMIQLSIGNFLKIGWSDQLDIAYCGSTKHFATSPGHAGSFKNQKMHFWMIQRAKKEVFGHFLDFGLLDRLGNAYFDSTKCFPRFGNITRSWRIIQKSQKCLFERSKVPKKRFLAVFWT